MSSNPKLPNFLIVGAAKCGTTSLFHYIRQHPEIFMPDNKEPFFFVSEIIKKQSNDDPRAKFEKWHTVFELKNYIQLFKGVKDETAVGEASTAYLYYHDTSIPLIKKILGDIKIIIFLRNPVDRAFSSYTRMLKRGWVKDSFEKTLELENYKLNNNWTHIQLCKSLGLYYNQVFAFKNNFSNVKVFTLDEIEQNIDDVIYDIFKFLGVSTSFKPNTEQKYLVSKSKVPKSLFLNKFILYYNKLISNKKSYKYKILKPFNKLINDIENTNSKLGVIKKETKIELLDFYESDILKLQDLISKDLNQWLKI